MILIVNISTHVQVLGHASSMYRHMSYVDFIT